MILRNIDAEDAGTGNHNLIFTSALTEQPLQLARTAQRMRNGAGFIYHCSEGQQGSVVAQEFTDAAQAGCLRKTFIGIHCNALASADWARWPKADAGAVVWSPFSNLWLYGSTTNIPEARKRGVLICLGSDWGPSGTKHVLAELKVAKLVSDAKHFDLSNRDLVQMITSNAGAALSRCWPTPIGTLATGAFGDVTVLRSSGTSDAWTQIVNARDRWRWTDIVARLNAVRKDPAKALAHAQGRRRAYAGPMEARVAPLELALDMPSGGGLATASPPPEPSKVMIPPLPTLVHDKAFFNDVHGRGFHGGLLDGLGAFYK